MGFDRIRALRTRLVAIVVAVMIPTTVLIALVAAATYRAVGEAIHETHASVAEAFALQMQATLRMALRLAGTIADAAADPPMSQGDCERLVARALAVNPGYVALRVKRPDGISCDAFGEHDGELRAAAVRVFERREPATAAVADDIPGVRAWFEAATLGGVRTVAVRSQRRLGSGELVAVAVFDGGFLQRTIEPMRFGRYGTVALTDHAGMPIVAQGAERTSPAWLPADFPNLDRSPAGAAAAGRDGVARRYAIVALPGGELFAVAGYQALASQAALTQLLVLAAYPLLVIVLLIFAYSIAVKRNVVDWITSIEKAARDHSLDPSARAPVTDSMPAEIRNVASAFNRMLDLQAARERALADALLHNHQLARELHHRVKNSLQVVQSYLGITKRDQQGEARAALAEAEARVQVLSSAHRLSLAEGEVRPVPLDTLLTETTDVASSILKRGPQRIGHRYATTAHLPVDQAIPAGLIVIEIVGRLLAARPGVEVRVEALPDGADRVCLSIFAEPPTPVDTASRLLAGLLRQLEAERLVPASEEVVLAVRFPVAPGPPA